MMNTKRGSELDTVFYSDDAEVSENIESGHLRVDSAKSLYPVLHIELVCAKPVVSVPSCIHSGRRVY